MPIQYKSVKDKTMKYVNPQVDPVKQQERYNADQDFYIMELEAKATKNEQELADVNFNLMIGGIL